MGKTLKTMGIDLHSNNFTYCLIYPDGKKVHGKFGISQGDMEEFYKVLDTDTAVSLVSQSLNHFRDSNPNHKSWYDGKTSGVKKKGKYRMALCRRVFAEVYQMLKKGEFHKFRDEKNHLKKMEEYNKFLEKRELVFKKSA